MLTRSCFACRYLDNRGNELSPEEFHKLMKSRAHGDTGLTKLEANVRQSFKVGKLNLVDLAGSERVRLTGATGQRLEESKKINQVSVVGWCFADAVQCRLALTQPPLWFPPPGSRYRHWAMSLLP